MALPLVAFVGLALATPDGSVLLPTSDGSVLLPTPDGSELLPKKIVFLHVQTAGGTTFVNWVAQLHAACARDVDPVPKSASRYVVDLNKGAPRKYNGPEVKLDATAETAGGADKLDSCGPARKVCRLGFKHEWASHATCEDRVQAYADAGCTFVELHHFDLSVAEAFRAKGFEVMTFLRDPVMRITSSMNKAYHLRRDTAEAYAMLSTPDNGMYLLTACDVRMWGKKMEDPDTSCSLEFANSRSSELQAVGQAIKTNLEFANSRSSDLQEIGQASKTNLDSMSCQYNKNMTEDAYAQLYEVASDYVQKSVSFVGVTERFSLMTKVWAKRYGVTALLPELQHVSPGNCEEEHCKTTTDLNLDEGALRKLYTHDQQLWCEMSARLSKDAQALRVTDASDDDGLKHVSSVCQ